MNGIDSNNSQGPSHNSAAPRHWWSGPLDQLKTKQIAWLTVPLIVMATITEFVILATGWKYQQSVCVPRGMGVTFFGIGPIGATILAVELLKLPLAIWTASRKGFQKVFMIACGLPLICLLTFQLVKDMAVYEMGIALAPAEQLLKDGDKEEIKIKQLNEQLAVIDQKKTDRDAKLADLAARKAKANADFQDQLKHIDDQRTDAISLTDYQKKELADVADREETIIALANNDAMKLKQTLADLRQQREQEVAAASQWNAEEARLDNAYQAKLAEYENAKAAYVKARAEYDNANALKRQFLSEPVDPGVAPVREVNTILKPTRLADLDDQIKSKETELASVDAQRRQRVAQVEDEANRMRAEFDTRSGDRRSDSDHKRDALLAAQAAATTKFAAEEKEIDDGFDATAQTADGIRSQIDDSRKQAETCYEARVSAIENTQVHRIATTVEIIRGLLMGKHPVSITLTPKERGDLYTDQISMVRIWVYPVLAFIVAFLPTLMVEIGFTTLFKPEAEEIRKQYRLGFLGRHLHTLYIRAGRQKILRTERLARQATSELSGLNRELTAARGTTEKALAEKETELLAAREEHEQAMKLKDEEHDLRIKTQTQEWAVKMTTMADSLNRAVAEKEEELLAARDSLNAASAARLEQLKRVDQEHEQAMKLKDEEYDLRFKTQTQEWAVKMTTMVDSLNRAVAEKNELRDLQKSEIERQIQMRQNAWSDRFNQMRQELDDQRTAAENERTAMMQAHQKKLLELTEDCKGQVIQARRQAAAVELAAAEATTKLTHDLKEVISARDGAEEQLKQQSETFSLRLTQAREESAREFDKTLRQEKHRAERLQIEFSRSLHQREEDFQHKLQQREQELSLAFDSRLADEQSRMEEIARRNQAETGRQLDVRAQEVDARWKVEMQQRDEAAQIRLRQREHQLQSQLEARLVEVQTAAQQESQRRETDWQRQADARVREADNRWSLELQQKELAAQTRLKQREQELVAQMNIQTQAELTSARAQWVAEVEKKVQAAAEPLKAMLARVEKERDQAVQTANETVRHAQQLEKKLSDASSFLAGWRNGNGNGNGNGSGKSVVPAMVS